MLVEERRTTANVHGHTEHEGKSQLAWVSETTERQLVCLLFLLTSWVGSHLMRPSRLSVCVPVCASVCVCVCTRWKTRMLGLASSTRNNHSPFTRSHLFTRNKKHTFISCGHAHNSDIHHTDILVQGTGQHAWLPASTHHYRYTHEPTGACSRPQPGGGGGKSRGGAACTWNRTSHSVNLTDANVINTLRLFLASAEYRTETWRCRIFLAGPDELGDHVYDYSRAVQKESCMGGLWQGPVFGQKDWRKAHMRGKKSSKGELKVRFGTLTGQIHNAGDDNDRPSH